MRLIILAAILAFGLAGEARAEEESILLHCAGEGTEDDKVQRDRFRKNVLIAKDGSWIKVGNEAKRERTGIAFGTIWQYKTEDKKYDSERIVFFDTKVMELDISSKNLSDGHGRSASQSVCFPITNPFTGK